MKISQYVYFALKSDTVTAETITVRLGLEPDAVLVRGSRQQDPPRPACHIWMIECKLPGLRVDQQVARVLDRLRPVADRARDLVTTADVWAVLEVVRYLDDEDGESERIESVVTADGLVLDKLPGQHHLLGWCLEADDLALLVSLKAVLDVDEYG